MFWNQSNCQAFRRLRLRRAAEGGFTLIEVVITLGILSVMMIAVTTLLRSSFEVRFALSDEAKLTHRISVAMQKISEDLAHAYLVSSKDTRRNFNDRATKTVFRIEKDITGGDKLALTCMNNRPLRVNAREGDEEYVSYSVQDAKETPGRKHLFRGSSGVLPEDFKEDPPMEVLARNIKAITFEFWNGDSWSKDKWNSERSDTKDLRRGLDTRFRAKRAGGRKFRGHPHLFDRSVYSQFIRNEGTQAKTFDAADLGEACPWSKTCARDDCQRHIGGSQSMISPLVLAILSWEERQMGAIRESPYY
jgi:prepilin-type N-terminal cleavage/methylation domain-containing protein